MDRSRLLSVVAVVGSLGGVIAGCGSAAPDDVAPSSLSPLTVPATSGGSVDAGGPSGFDTVFVRVTDESGAVCERCMWLATTAEQRARGLMLASSLGGLAGMVFEYTEPAVRRFWMKDTIVPLSIAFADASGAVVGTADMDPCTSAPCPNFGPDVPFTIAVEVPQGDLEELGLVAGSTVELIGDCPPPAE